MKRNQDKNFQMNASNIVKEFIRLDYKNGLYQGQHTGYHKEGLGCFCSDDGLFYLGLFKNNHIFHFYFEKGNGPEII